MSYEEDSIFWVDVEKIIPNPFQPRREFDQEKLKDLSDSIRMYGLLQPLTVTRKEIIKEDGSFTTHYELIAGERRFRASKLIGLTQVPVIIRAGEQTELMKLELAIIENIQREDLNAVDRALAFKQLSEQFKLSHVEVAKKVGRSREYVSNSIRLLLLPEFILNALRMGDISDGHARTLLMLKDRPEEQDTVFRETLLKKLSVREVERIARKIATDKVRKQNWLNSDPELIEIEKRFTESLGTRVQISKTDYGGKLTIDYFSDEDLDKLFDLINQSGITPNQFVSNRESIEALTEATVLEPAEREDLGPFVHRVDQFEVGEQSPADNGPDETSSRESDEQQETIPEENQVSNEYYREPNVPEPAVEEVQNPFGEEAVQENAPEYTSSQSKFDNTFAYEPYKQQETVVEHNRIPDEQRQQENVAQYLRESESELQEEKPQGQYEEKPEEEKKSNSEPEDTDLYSIRNFSL